MRYLIVILAFFIVSCGTVNRNIQKTATVENTQKTVIDLSETEIIRKVDTTVSTKMENTSSTLSANEIDSCKDSIITKETKSGNITLKTSYNKNTKKFTAEATKDVENLHVVVDETIKKKSNIVSDEKQQKKVKTITKHVEKESSFNPTGIIIWIVAIIAMAVLMYFLIGKATNFKR